MALHVIPLSNTDTQHIFSVSVEVDGRILRLMLHIWYNTEADFWKMDVIDGVTKEYLIANAPLVTGEYPAGDLMRQFRYLGLGSVVIVPVSDETKSDRPQSYDLGSNFQLLWGDTGG